VIPQTGREGSIFFGQFQFSKRSSSRRTVQAVGRSDGLRLSIRRARASGPDERARLSGARGSSLRIAAMVSAQESCRNGWTPMSVSHKTTPSPKMSELAARGVLLSCSGDI
jgi:hypothetical protein